jgi:hypothetical protein
VLDAPGTRIVVQAKRWSQSVGPRAVQEVVASQAQYGTHNAIVITNSNFTKAALELALSNNVEMWDRSKLIEFLATQDLGPPRTGGALLADELKAGAPTAFKGALVVFLGVLAASAAGSKSGRKASVGGERSDRQRLVVATLKQLEVVRSVVGDHRRLTTKRSLSRASRSCPRSSVPVSLRRG